MDSIVSSSSLNGYPFIGALAISCAVVEDAAPIIALEGIVGEYEEGLEVGKGRLLRVEFEDVSAHFVGDGGIFMTEGLEEGDVFIFEEVVCGFAGACCFD